MPPTENPKGEDRGDESSDLIEGGTVEPMSDVDFVPKRHREATARAIAISLVGILAGSAFLHYASVLLLLVYNQTAAVEQLDRFFNAWLPVISGLVGSATTYYFTRDKS